MKKVLWPALAIAAATVMAAGSASAQVKVGVAGSVGFGGGFRPYGASPFGEPEWKYLYAKIVEETRKLDRGLAAVSGADHIIAMKAGRIVAEGPPADVITAETVEEVFGLTCRITEDPVSGTPLVIPIGRHHQTPHAMEEEHEQSAR